MTYWLVLCFLLDSFGFFSVKSFHLNVNLNTDRKHLFRNRFENNSLITLNAFSANSTEIVIISEEAISLFKRARFFYHF